MPRKKAAEQVPAPAVDLTKNHTERRAERAEQSVSAAPAPAEPAGAGPDVPQFSIQDLWARVGQLTVEIDLWRAQATKAQTEVERLKALYEGPEEAPNDVEEKPS